MSRALLAVFSLSGLLLLVEVSFFGGGLALPSIPFSVRRALFVGVLLSATLYRVVTARGFTRNELGLIGTVMLLIACWAFIVPRAYGYPLSYSIADASPWTALLVLAVWPWSHWGTEQRWTTIRRLVVGLGVALATLHIVIWVLLLADIVTREALEFAAAMLMPADASGDSFIIRVAATPWGYRIYSPSSIFLLATIYFLFAYRPKPMTALWLGMLGVVLVAIWTTQIRAFFAALLIAGLLTPIIRWLRRRTALVTSSAFTIALWLLAIVATSVAISPALLEATGLARAGGSDYERLEQVVPLLTQWMQRPLMGNGFGSYVPDLTRSIDAPFSYELTFHALIMKVGLLGILLTISMLAIGLRTAGASRTSEVPPRKFAFWLAFTTGIWFSGATNPMLLNFAGMTMLVLLLVDLGTHVRER